MAYLLGSKNCLESLAMDICDVQEIITDIFSRVGPVRFPSWKYPDKTSSDLDIAELLTRYCYSKDEEHSKLSHIILFELLIDRLVLLLQALSSFCNHLLSSTSSDRPQTAKSVGSAMSVGLVVKKFWNKMVHLYQILDQELRESSTKFRKMKSMEETIADMKQEISMLQDLLKNKQAKHSPVKGGMNGKTSAKLNLSPHLDKSLENQSSSQDVTSFVDEVALTRTCKEVAVQTYDTAFVPCEACSRTQENLIEVGQMVIKVCESQGLPSSLAKQKRLLKQSLLAAADVSRWAAEQNRDLSRINNHLDNLYGQIQPLQEKLSKAREKKKELEGRVKELEKCVEDEKLEGQKIYKDFSGKLSTVKKEKMLLEENSNREIKELNKMRDFLEKKIDKSQEELRKSTTENSNLEYQREQLESDLEKEKLETTRLKDIDKDLNKTKTTLNEMKIKLEKTTLELGKMEAKNKSLAKHDQALQGKHDALLQRIDELDQECEELREQVMDYEAERDELNEVLNETNNRSETLSKELATKQQELHRMETDRNNLTRTIETLEDDVHRLQHELRETVEKMKLIVEYPSDMDAGNIGHIRKGGGALDSPTVIALEMEKQISSNNIRIALFEEQNKKLRHSIEKLTEVNQQFKTKQMDEPVLLWNPRDERSRSGNKDRVNTVHHRSNSFDNRRSTSDSQKTGNQNTSASATNVRQGVRPHPDNYRPRPPSDSKPNQKNGFQISREKVLEKRQAKALSAKLAASGKTVTDFLPHGSEKQAAEREHAHNGARDDASTTVYEPVNTFVCEACDKMYTTQKDLDIHKAFCYELQA